MHALLAIAIAVSIPPARFVVQEPAKPIPPDVAAIHREMDGLFKEIELLQRSVDRGLFAAGTDPATAKASAAAGVGDLLSKARDDNRRAVSDIDRLLLLIASHTHPGGGT
jgi:hypothetical protein